MCCQYRHRRPCRARRRPRDRRRRAHAPPPRSRSRRHRRMPLPQPLPLPLPLPLHPPRPPLSFLLCRSPPCQQPLLLLHPPSSPPRRLRLRLRAGSRRARRRPTFRRRRRTGSRPHAPPTCRRRPAHAPRRACTDTPARRTRRLPLQARGSDESTINRRSFSTPTTNFFGSSISRAVTLFDHFLLSKNIVFYRLILTLASAAAAANGGSVSFAPTVEAGHFRSRYQADFGAQPGRAPAFDGPSTKDLCMGTPRCTLQSPSTYF